MSNENNGKILLGILAGVAAGATLGILFAPDSGANTRKKIVKKGDDYVSGLNSQFNHLVHSLNDEVDGFKEEINQLVVNGKAKLEEEKVIANNIKNELTRAVG